MSLLRTIAGAALGSVIAERSAGRGLLGAGLGVLATRLATRSLPGALLVGGAIAAKTVYDRRKAIRNNPSKVIIDQEVD